MHLVHYTCLLAYLLDVTLGLRHVRTTDLRRLDVSPWNRSLIHADLREVLMLGRNLHLKVDSNL